MVIIKNDTQGIKIGIGRRGLLESSGRGECEIVVKELTKLHRHQSITAIAKAFVDHNTQRDVRNVPLDLLVEWKLDAKQKL